LDESIVRRAADAGIFISLSFDGVQEAQDAGRVRPDGSGTFADADRALRLLVAARRPFGVYSVITPRNVRHLAESRQFLWEAGARILVSAVDYTAHWDDDAVRTLVEQYEKVGHWYGKLLERREHFHVEPIDSRIAQRTRRQDWRRCHPGISQVTVAPDGTLFGCVEFFYRRLYPLGTASGWLEQDKVKAFASQHLAGRPDECKSCGVADRCTNSCACVNLRATGRANVPPESVCYTEQATILTIDRVAEKLYRRRVPEFLMRHYSSSYHLLSGIEKLLQEYGVDDEN
jgi:radical SAM protein with 4Fe4S-binding SPASM domain